MCTSILKHLSTDVRVLVESRRTSFFFFALLLMSPCQLLFAQSAPSHFVFFNFDRNKIKEREFYENWAFAGAQLKYSWKELEVERDIYDFTSIEEDLTFLLKHGKRLFIQIQDVSFDPKRKNVPEYVLKEPEFHGGADQQYEFFDDSDARATPMGWVARRWDSAVASRFHKLLAALGSHFDGRIEGINLPETSVDFGSTGKYHPGGFSPAGYRDAIIGNMTAARSSLKKSAVLQYANFMPGEWLPWNDKGYLASIFQHAAVLGIGVGGPDLIPYKKNQMNHSYRFARQYQGKILIGYAVQEGNYSERNEQTGRVVTIEELYAFAVNDLKVNYLFWYCEEPYYTRDVIPFLKNIKREIHPSK